MTDLQSVAIATMRHFRKTMQRYNLFFILTNFLRYFFYKLFLMLFFNLTMQRYNIIFK